MEIVQVVVSAASALATLVLGVVAYRLSKAAAAGGARRAIGDLSNHVSRIRLEYPEVMGVGAEWREGFTQRALGPGDDDEQRRLARYWAYVDVGLEYCNTALVAAAEGAISRRLFDAHHRPLIRLFLAENWRFVDDALRGPFLSAHVRDEIAAAEQEGVNFRELHRELTGS